MSEQELLRYVGDAEDLLYRAATLVKFDETQLEQANIRLAVEKIRDAMQVLEGLRALIVLA